MTDNHILDQIAGKIKMIICDIKILIDRDDRLAQKLL